MRWLTILVHSPDFALEKEFEARRERINVRSSQYRNPAVGEKMANVAQKIDGTLHMLDDFNRGDKAKRGWPQLRCKILLVEIQRKMRKLGIEASGIAIDGEDIASEGLQPSRHGTGSCAEICSAHPGMSIAGEHTLANEFVQAVVGRGVGHQSFILQQSWW